MINRTVSVLTLALCLGACATTQSGGGSNSLTVSKGDRRDYSTQTTMEIVQAMGGQDMRVKMTADGTTTLTALDRASDRIDWALDMKDMHISSDNPMVPMQDKTVTLPTQNFSTTALGKVLGKPTSSDAESQEDQMVTGLTGGQQVSTWFSPLPGSGHKVGDSWEEQTSDTISNSAMGMELRREITTRYTFDGVVDTLGMKASRVRTATTAMTIEGELSVQGFDLAVDGDGVMSGVNYYAQSDGLLLANVNEVQMNMRISVPGQGVMPITQHMTTIAARKK